MRPRIPATDEFGSFIVSRTEDRRRIHEEQPHRRSGFRRPMRRRAEPQADGTNEKARQIWFEALIYGDYFGCGSPRPSRMPLSFVA